MADVDGQQVGFPLVEHEPEVLRGNHVEALERVEQLECVEEPDVEGVAGERLGEIATSLVDLPDPELVEPEQPLDAGVVGIAPKALRGQIGRVAVQPAVGGQVRQLREQCGVARIVGQDRIPHPHERVLLSRQEMRGGQDRARLERARIDLQSALRQLTGALHVLDLDTRLGREYQRRHERRVHVQRLLDGLAHARLPVEPERARQPHLCGRVVRVHRQRAVEVRGGVASLVLGQEQLTQPHLRLGVVRIGLDRLVERAAGVVEQVGDADAQVGDCRSHRHQVLGVQIAAAVVDVDEAVEAGIGILEGAPPELDLSTPELRHQPPGGSRLDRGGERGGGLVQPALCQQCFAQVSLEHVVATGPARDLLRLAVSTRPDQHAGQSRAGGAAQLAGQLAGQPPESALGLRVAP